ncbi:hypothetical protein [Micromonospora thermarum]|uniref:Uncharacterized protein n=1 Tax=Micromonospora thermarum TaxID=2720024 RepID=A0ABX0Z9L8_9ACTN|nr:hypothetical protein [Micromonospora thermarum]NJP33674.1 hypothetical protein [Micromonospora thermarum]
MQVSQALDVMEALLRAAEHPDIVEVARYGADTQPGGQSPPGVKAKHENGSYAMLWAEVPPRDARPMPLGEMPPPRLRARRILVLAHQLLDVARPEPFASWELCATPGVGDWTGGDPPPSALRITCRDRSVVYLRGTAASGDEAEPETDPYPDYQIPQGVREWHHRVSAPTAEPVSA